MKYLLIIMAFVFIGCENKAMSPQEISKEVKECKDNNLSVRYLSNIFIDGGYSVTKIRCFPKE